MDTGLLVRWMYTYGASSDQLNHRCKSLNWVSLLCVPSYATINPWSDMYTASDLLTFINSKTGKKYTERAVSVSTPVVVLGSNPTRVTLTAKNAAYGFKGSMSYNYKRVTLSEIKYPKSRVFTINNGRPISDIFSQLQLTGWTADFDELKNQIITYTTIKAGGTSGVTGAYSLQAKDGSYLYVDATSIQLKVI